MEHEDKGISTRKKNGRNKRSWQAETETVLSGSVLRVKIRVVACTFFSLSPNSSRNKTPCRTSAPRRKHHYYPVTLECRLELHPNKFRSGC